MIMDVFTRIMRGWQLGLGLGVELTLDALELALTKGRPEIHYSDQGLQYPATDYKARLLSAGARVSMAEVAQSA
jgi:putative transposase